MFGVACLCINVCLLLFYLRVYYVYDFCVIMAYYVVLYFMRRGGSPASSRPWRSWSRSGSRGGSAAGAGACASAPFIR